MPAPVWGPPPQLLAYRLSDSFLPALGPLLAFLTYFPALAVVIIIIAGCVLLDHLGLYSARRRLGRPGWPRY